MSKKLLSERQIRRFAKLANMPVINEFSKAGEYRRERVGGVETRAGEGPEGHYKDYMQEQDEFEEEEIEDVDPELPPGEEMVGGDEIVDDEAEMDPEMGAGGMDLGGREELAMDVIAAVADVLDIEIDIEGGEAGGEEIEDIEMTDEPDLGGEGEPDLGGGEEELGGEEEFEEEEMVMEALRGINYVPGKKEVVNEVAKRVARRLLKAKRAEQQLQEALGGGPRRTPRRTAKTSATRQRRRPTRNSRRRTKK